MNINQRDIVLINIPFSNLENGKLRPALVVSNNLLNLKSEDFIAAPLTSVLKDEPYSILITQEDLSHGNLIKTSRIRLDKIVALSKNLIRNKIGAINLETFDRVKEEFISLI